jgi:hypothetical protein
MAETDFEKWLATLGALERQKALELLREFQALNADAPEGWVYSEISENIAQYTRYIFLKPIWSLHIENWSRDPSEWIEQAISAIGTGLDHREGAGHALRRMKEAGVLDADLGVVAQMIATETTFAILNRVDEGHDPTAGENAPGWAFMETGGDEGLTGRAVGGLHESLLSVKPPG